MFPLHARRMIARSVLVIAVLAAADCAAAQSDSDLRNENQRLRTQVADLQRELEAAQQRIAELERQVEQLRQLLAASRRVARPAPATQPQPPEVSIDESIPNASPRALLNALKESYRDAMGDLEIGESGDRVRTVYVRTLERWTARVNREFKSKIEWHIRVIEAQQARRAHIRAQAVDPKTGVELGDPFDVALSRSLARKLEQLAPRGELDVLRLKGVLTPAVSVNRQRQDVGPFDNPRLIGPFAEFAFAVTASSVTAVPEDQQEQPGDRPRGKR